MKQRTSVDVELVMTLEPCKEEWPEKRVRETIPKPVTLVEGLRMKNIPPQDRIWVALRKEFIDKRTAVLFVCDCAERALARERDAGREPSKSSWNAIEVARRHLKCKATEEEVWAAARAARWLSARAAERAAASAAATAAAKEWEEEAARAAARAAWLARPMRSNNEEREWQCEHLAQMLEQGQ